MRILKQSTAYELMVFMTDSSDHVTGKTGLTLTITASKAAGAFASIVPTVTERGSGWYDVSLTTGHTDTLGDFVLHVTGTGADPTDIPSQVRANVLGDTLPANLSQILGTALTETVAGYLAAAFKKLYDVASPVLTAASVNQTGDAYARLGAPAGASVSADVAAVKTDTAAIKTDVESTGVVVAAASKTGYALTSAYDPAKTAAQAGDAMALTSSERTTLTGVIWAALTSGLTTVGSIGKLIVDNLNATISSRLASSSYTAPDNASVTAIKAKTDNLPSAPAAAGDAMALTTSERNATADALLDRTNGIETGVTLRQALRLKLAVLLGKVSGADLNTPTFRSINDTKDRVTATTDGTGNRTSVTFDGT